MINITDKIPLHVSAFAPKARKMTAEIADGWITFSASPERAVHENAEMAKACREVGRDPKTLYTTAFALGCVLKPGESAASPRAKAQAGPMAVVTLHGLIERSIDGLLPPYIQKLAGAYREQYATYQPADAKYLQMHKMHLLGVRAEEEKYLTEDFLRETTFTATEEVLRDRLRAFKEAGYNQFVVQLVPGHEDAIEDWARLFAKV